MNAELPVLSIYQPHASALCHPDHPKTIETRGRRIRKRGWVLVYATITSVHPQRVWDGTWLYTPPVRPNPYQPARPARLESPRHNVSLPRGAIVGAVELIDSVPVRRVDWSQSGIDGGVVVVGRDLEFGFLGHADGRPQVDITDQLAWGDYDADAANERWGWVTGRRVLFAEPIKITAPHQGWWKHTIDADELLPKDWWRTAEIAEELARPAGWGREAALASGEISQ